MSRAVRHVGLSLGNIDRFVDGLGEFASQLGRRLAARAPEWHERHGIALHFHVHPALVGCFGNEVGYLPVHRAQEWLHRQPLAFDVWHTLNQLNRYPAPAGTRVRVLTLHDLNFLYFKNGFSRWRDMRRLRQRLAQCDRLVTISDWVREDARRHTGWTGPAQTIHNGARDLTAEPQQAVPGLAAGGFLFHISRMSRSKNVEALIDMAAVWPEQPLVLAGPAAVRNAELEALARSKGLSNVRVLTMVSDAQKAWLYAHCAAFVFPSLTEGFGLPPIEAMHFGRPVVLSDRTCLPEIGADACDYFRDFEPPSMKAVVQRAIARHRDEPGRAEAVRAHARRFGWDACAQAYAALLTGLALGDEGSARR